MDDKKTSQGMKQDNKHDNRSNMGAEHKDDRSQMNRTDDRNRSNDPQHQQGHQQHQQGNENPRDRDKENKGGWRQDDQQKNDRMNRNS